MRGGHFVEARFVRTKRAHALRQAGVALLAIHFTWASVTTTFCASAQPNHEAHSAAAHSAANFSAAAFSATEDGQCEPDRPREQSILISDKVLVEGEQPLAARGEEMLEPIAKVSPNVPELADPLMIAQTPTPANPFAAQRKSPYAPKQSEPSVLTMAEIEVASFHGITPGISNRINVLRTWGDPRSEDTQATELKYRFDNLPAVNVRFDGNRVETIQVQLAKPTRMSTLTRKLKLQQVRPVIITAGNGTAGNGTDENDTAIAQFYPEHGVELRYAEQELGLAIASDDVSDIDTTGIDAMGNGTSPRIDSILIQSIQAGPFLLRAEASAKHNFTNTIADLEAALRLDRNLDAARAQLAEIHLKIGKAVTAERYASEAVELKSQNVTYRLQWAKCLRQLARYDRAVEEVQTVLETPGIGPLVRAQALNEMGLLASLGSQKVARRAVPLHSKAIELADSLAVGDDPLVRLPAKQLLVEAHLAVAVEISTGAWQQKDEVVPQWIERASALAEALIAEDASYLPLRLQVAVSSLAAAANLEVPINPLLWIEEAEETVAAIKGNTDTGKAKANEADAYDSLAASQFDWQLGLAYFHGSQIEHRRSEPDSAVHLGELADQQLAELAKGRDEMPDTAYLLGRLYFQIGAVHAVHYEDHVTACQWYDEAVDRLLNPVPVTTMAAPQQHGDALVSMGVSYWNQDNRQRAIEVTEAGVELIEQAVSSGLLEDETLMVSYNNLAAMHAAQGDKKPAARYEKLAKRITGSKVLQRR